MHADAIHPSNPLISNTPPSRTQHNTTLVVAIVAAVVFLGLAPFARIQMPAVPMFIPIYESVLITLSLITAAFLFKHFKLTRSVSLLILASGFGFCALMAAAHEFSFPGLFFSGADSDEASNRTAWLYFLWHGGFPLFAAGYAVLKKPAFLINEGREAQRHAMVAMLAAIGFFALCLYLPLHTPRLLPDIMQGDQDRAGKIVVALICLLPSSVALVALYWNRPFSILDEWLVLVVGIWAFDCALSSVLNHARYDVGWYAGRVFGLIGSSFVLIQLIQESGRLYCQLLQLRAIDFEQLKASRVRFQATFEQAAVGMAHVALDGRWLRVNQRLCHIVGYSYEEMLNRTFQDITHPADLELDLENVAKTLSGEIAMYRVEKRYIRRDGHWIWINLTASLIRDDRGQPDFFIAVIEDIQQRKAAEAALAKANEAAKAADVAKNAFLSKMSHEMRTPLHQISSLAMLLQRETLTEKQFDRVNKIGTATHHLTCIVDAILLLTQMFAGKFKMTEEPLTIEAVFAEVMSGIAQAAQSKALNLEMDASPSNAVFIGDIGQLRTALSNYAANAVRFTEEGRIILRSRLLEEDDTLATLRFEVEDSGMGIAPEAMPRMFSIFEQADNSSTRRFGGVGLGLAVTKTIAQMMGGDAGVSSVAGKGSTFWFTAKLKKPTLSAAEGKPLQVETFNNA